MKGHATTSRQTTMYNQVSQSHQQPSSSYYSWHYSSLFYEHGHILEYNIEETPLSRNRFMLIKAKGKCILGLKWKPLVPKLVVQLTFNLFVHPTWDLEHGPLPKLLQKNTFSTPFSTTLEKNLKLQTNRKVSQPQPQACDQSKGLQRCEPRLSLRVTFHVPDSAKECEGLNPHTPK